MKWIESHQGLLVSQVTRTTANMPIAVQACKPDWNLIQGLYLKGMAPKEIERQTGVKALNVSVHASRKGWRKALTASSVIVARANQVIEVNPPTESKLAKQSERTRTALADVIARSAEKLASMSIHTPSTALRVNQDAESMVRNAKTVFGWSEGQSSPSVRIAILGDATIASDAPTQPVIDVQSESKSQNDPS